MSFKIDPEVGAALAKLFGDTLPERPAIGDIDTRRKNNYAFFGVLSSLVPTIETVETQDFYTKAEDGHEVLCRWFTKKGVQLAGSSAVCYAHGGGMITLSINDYDSAMKRYVDATGVPFFVVEYRLAPEFKAPTQVTDTYAGLQYLHSHAEELGVDPSRIAVMGDSGGAAITASLTHYIKHKNGPHVAKQILIYPMLDDRSTATDQHIAPFATWNGDDNQTAWRAVLGDDKFGSDNVSPVEAGARMTIEDARGLPPAYIDVGELDLFRDETLEYAKKLGQAGVSCELHLFPGVPHAFEIMAPEAEVTRRAFAERYRALNSL